MVHFQRSHVVSSVGLGALLVGALVFAVSDPASATTVIDGPVNLGTATSYGVLGASTVTNTGPTIVTGDLGLSPGTSITGFSAPPNGSVVGTIHQTDAPAALAQNDLTTAYNVAASLTPMRTGLTDLAGASLAPGVYRGGALSLTGTLALAGTAQAVWVFQAASTLMISSNTHIVLTGGASACNVFWQVGSSATIGTAADFVGTVMAAQSVTATTGATIQGRLLARTGAVTLDDNVITAPTTCADASTTVVSTSPSPDITSSAPSGATVGQAYSFTVTASGTPAPSFAVSSGALPAGLQLDTVTGVISGTPTQAGVSTFEITASNGVSPDVIAGYTLTASVAPAVRANAVSDTSTGTSLAATGRDVTSTIATGIAALVLGGAMLAIGRRGHRAPRRH
ncbi:ice-binding family protein [Lacisediminihabitans sp.]|uniref:ice-binding family protein n=1 Tax=Lacisediminihabitans sp. TaxID=2787631 RepID=UPI00374D9286